MKKLITAVLGGTAVASLAFASASMLTVDGGTIQAGQDGSLYCDTDGVKASWGLETDDNTVRSVNVTGIDSRCDGAEMFVRLDNGAKGKVTLTSSGTASIALPTGTTPESVNSIRIWIEG